MVITGLVISLDAFVEQGVYSKVSIEGDWGRVPFNEVCIERDRLDPFSVSPCERDGEIGPA